MDLRNGDGLVDEEEEESLSFAEAVSAADGCREITSSLISRDEGTFKLAKGKSGSSKSLELFVGAMAFYDRSWRYFMEI